MNKMESSSFKNPNFLLRKCLGHWLVFVPNIFGGDWKTETFSSLIFLIKLGQ